MEKTKRFDLIRTAILNFLDEIMKKARNENMARETDVVIQRALRSYGYKDNEVNQELMYLVDKGYVKKTKTTSTGNALFGTSKMKFTTVDYNISSEGRDFLYGSSEQFSKKNLFGGININNIHGAIAIGENNIAVVHKENLNLYQELNSLKEAVLISDKLDDEKKGEYVGDIETIKNQVAKKNPNLKIVSIAWQAIQGLVTIEGIIQIIDRIKPLVENLIR